CRQEDTVIDNGSVEAGTAPFVEVSPILFKCNVGFITATLCNGTNSLVCQEDGSWKGNAGYGVEWITISVNDIIEDIGFWLKEVICSGFESNLNECKQNQWGVNNFNPTKYIGISCGNPCSEPSTFPPPRSG
ncbi:hypothetical protein MAR_004210, partial [Mya arenaria]